MYITLPNSKFSSKRELIEYCKKHPGVDSSVDCCSVETIEKTYSIGKLIKIYWRYL